MFWRIRKWWYRVNRYIWSTDMRIGCERALQTFREAKAKLEVYKDFQKHERDFLAVERDHKILISRSRRLEQMIKDEVSFDFDSYRQEIYDKLCEVRTKYKELSKIILEPNGN